MQKFKVFYSWQSDLPSSKTRNFIRECIDDAIDLAQETDAIEAERDEATTGTTGSPNIVTTLFSKIDDCDLFIADLSLCFTGNQNNEKRSPNPNVLLELGYAVKVLGWERVICLCNTDYGKEYPFDVAHNRITDFSLENKNKNEVKNCISKIIFINIRDIRKQPPRAKTGMAAHMIGTYDSNSQDIVCTLRPIEISEQESYSLHNKELLAEAKELFVSITELTSRILKVRSDEEKLRIALPKQPTVLIQPQLPDVFHAIKELNDKPSEQPVLWRNVESDRKRIKHWLDIDVTNDFFDMGGLTQVVQLLKDVQYNGTNDEKEKNEKLNMLSYKLLLLDLRSDYLKTFEGMYFFPLAIKNISHVQDSDIRIVVSVVTGESIEPNEHLIWKEYEGLQGQLCRDDEENDIGVIAELFILPEDEIIHTEPIPNDFQMYMPRMPILTVNGFAQPSKTEEDYKNELKEFIASTNNKGYYEFEVASLCPSECKWLCQGLLIRPINDEVKISYRIYSAHSTGDLNSILEFKDAICGMTKDPKTPDSL